MYPSSKTIAAIATAAGGGIGIIRVSGPQALEICGRVCSPAPADMASHHLYLGQLVDLEAGEVVDQVLFCMMRAPRSYTGEDVLEIHAHGGRINLQRILGVVLRAGAVAAEPGEFTKRGFLNGKMDFIRAEGLAELIGAQTVRAARQAQRLLAGDLGIALRELRKRAIRLLGEIEGMLDFPEAAQDATDEPSHHDAQSDAVMNHSLWSMDLRAEVGEISRRIRTLSESFWRGGKMLHSGVEIAFVGQTNVGKSSLINALCSAERLLVYAQPGTTRDYVEIRTEWLGIPVLLVDTAGQRADATDVERLGIRLAQERWSRADLLILVIDGTIGMSHEEQRLFEGEASRCIVAWNKIDQEACTEPGLQERIVPCSALCGWGLDRLKQDALEVLAPHIGEEGEMIITSERQARLLGQAASYLEEVGCSLLEERSSDLVAADLRMAVEVLGEITGEEASLAAPIIDSIFAQLCIGK